MNVRAEIDFRPLMEPVARALWGEPNPRHSKPNDLRWGTNGSRSVKPGEGVWHDHEVNKGGGVLELIRLEKGVENGAAFDWMQAQGFLQAAEPQSRKSRLDKTYDYVDEAGALLFQVCRYEPKKFNQRVRDDSERSGWRYNIGGVRRVLYRLPELIAAPADAIVFLTEGEKDADRLISLGLVATTNPQGAEKWRPEYAEPLKGRRIVILPDNDEAGRKHVAKVRASLQQAGVHVVALDLDGLPPKGDVSDWLDQGGSAETLQARAVEALKEPEPRSRFTPSPFALRAPSAIPPRRWLYGRHLIAGFVSLTVSPGGLGKSSLALVEALAMVTGRNLLGASPAEPLRVWVWNGEDPRDEIERRVAAACVHYRITAEDLGDRLLIDSGRDMPISLASSGREGVVIVRPDVEAMVEAIKGAKIGVMVVDPFVTTHAVSENDNSAINAVVSLWREVADRTGCAVELVHHAQKAALLHGGELGVSQSRGASALIDGVRSARFLVGMTEDEAAKAGVEKNSEFFRVEFGKANLAPRPDKASWRRMVSVALGNGSGLYPEGDFVGVATPWEWPDAFEGVDLGVLAKVQEALAEGDWRESEQATKWAGCVVARVLGVDVGPPKKDERSREQKRERARVKTMLAKWLRNGALIKEPRSDSRTGREVPCITPGEPAHAL